jgi:hypothetical protein
MTFGLGPGPPSGPQNDTALRNSACLTRRVSGRFRGTGTGSPSQSHGCRDDSTSPAETARPFVAWIQRGNGRKEESVMSRLSPDGSGSRQPQSQPFHDVLVIQEHKPFAICPLMDGRRGRAFYVCGCAGFCRRTAFFGFSERGGTGSLSTRATSAREDTRLPSSDEPLTRYMPFFP